MRFATDENFDGRILDGLLERLPDLDIVRIQDTEMYQAPDDKLLNWLAEQGRILLTHDKRTIPPLVTERVQAGFPIPGIVLVKRQLPIGQLVDELELVLGAGKPEDFENQVCHIPLQSPRYKSPPSA